MANDFLKVKDAALAKYQILSDDATDDLKTHRINAVKVLDYGQGDCNAVVDDQGHPILFFDMGGGKHTGSRTHPWHNDWAGQTCKNNKLDLALKPTVILSHWDGDHYSTAWYITWYPTNATGQTTKQVPVGHAEVKDLQWLVPRQNKHPSKLEIVTMLTNIRCWPDTVVSHRFNLDATTDLVVEKCIGGSGEYDPNLDGLAVRLERVKAGGDPSKEADVVARILMPGDRAYQFIPSCAGGPPPAKMAAMLAFHHGSETHLDAHAIAAMPAAKDASATIAYTFGLKPDGRRCYGHPSQKAIGEYEHVNKNWTTKVCPSGGFIATDWPPGPDLDSTQQANRADQTLPLPPAPTPQSISLRRKKKLGS